MGGSPTSTTAWSIILLSPIKWNVSVLDHVLDLPSHGNGEKNAEIHQKNRPKDRYIKDAKEAAYNGNHCSLVAEYQNLNSGRRRIKGLNSSSALVGNAGPSSISFSCVSNSIEGSNLGVKKARNRFNK